MGGYWGRHFMACRWGPIVGLVRQGSRWCMMSYGEVPIFKANRKDAIIEAVRHRCCIWNVNELNRSVGPTARGRSRRTLDLFINSVVGLVIMIGYVMRRVEGLANLKMRFRLSLCLSHLQPKGSSCILKCQHGLFLE